MLSHKLLSKKKKYIYIDIFEPSNMNYFHTVIKKKKGYFINAFIIH